MRSFGPGSWDLVFPHFVDATIWFCGTVGGAWLEELDKMEGFRLF